MDPRSARGPYTRGVYHPASRPAPRPMDEGVDSMRVGGYVMLALAASELLQKFLLSFWLDLDKSTTGAAGTALFEAMLGIAMLQGSNAARKVVLWLSALGALATGGIVAVLQLAGFGHIWPVFAASAAVLAGVFLLNVSREPSRTVVVGALGLVLAGWVGSIAAAVLLAGSLDLATIKMIRTWSAADRTFEDAAAGLTVKAPPQWVLLKEGNPVAGDEKPMLTLANTEIVAFAHVNREARTYSVSDNLEFFLDGLAKRMGTEETEFQALGRTDTRIGGVAARRMKGSWKSGKSDVVASFTAWRDGPVFYWITVVTPRVITKRLDEQADELERGVTFSAPWTVFLRDAGARARQECPLLSEASIVGLTRTVARTVAPEVYCREAYRLASAGQRLLDPGDSARLAGLMKTFFAALPRAQADRFGAYAERLRAGLPTTAAEDRDMMQAARVAVDGLPRDVQDDLRGHFAVAMEMGQVSGGTVPR